MKLLNIIRTLEIVYFALRYFLEINNLTVDDVSKVNGSQ